MSSPVSRPSPSPGYSWFNDVLGQSAPHLSLFTICLLLFLYGYEIFNFSLSIDEELYGYLYESDWWLQAIAQGRWGMGLLARIFPPFGNIPMISTVLFCAGVGLSACLLARALIRSHPGQWAFVGVFVASPFWPHIAEFNTISWTIGVGLVLLTVAFLLAIDERRFGAVWAAILLAIATGIYQTFYPAFLLLICLRLLAVLLGVVPNVSVPQKMRWLKVGLIVVGGMVVYLAVQTLLLKLFSIHLTYVQGYIADFTNISSEVIRRTLERCAGLFLGLNPVFLGYGYVVILLPLLGLIVIVSILFWRGSLTRSQRLLTGGSLVAALLLAVSPILMSAGTIPIRSLIAWIPLNAFLAGVVLAKLRRFRKPLYVALGAALFVCTWISVALFHTDHLARQRDAFLASRLMARVDQVLPNPPAGRIPFVLIGAPGASPVGEFRKLEVFGDSFFDRSHEGGNPWRVAAYLTQFGVDTLEPRSLADIGANRAEVEAMPIWPAPNSVAVVNGFLVIKLGPVPSP